jgi:hypothetical protein
MKRWAYLKFPASFLNEMDTHNTFHYSLCQFAPWRFEVSLLFCFCRPKKPVQEWKYGLGQNEDAEGAPFLAIKKNGAQLSDAHVWPGKKGNQNTTNRSIFQQRQSVCSKAYTAALWAPSFQSV